LAVADPITQTPAVEQGNQQHHPPLDAPYCHTYSILPSKPNVILHLRGV
jgi:hypothetical protein